MMRSTAVLAAATMLLLSCGRTEGPCVQVTQVDAEEILGQPVKDAVSEGNVCRYESVSSGRDVATLAVAIHHERSVRKAREGYEAWKRKWGSGQVVDGLGDSAYLQTQGKAGETLGTGTLSVVRGRTWLVLSLVVAEKKASYAALLEVAKRVVRDA